VYVTDINDNFPEFAANYNHTIMENENFDNRQVLEFAAIDRDIRANGPPFSFEMNCTTSGSTPTRCNTPYGQSFGLSENTGMVKMDCFGKVELLLFN